MNNSDDVRQLLTEIRDALRALQATQEEAVNRQKVALSAWYRIIVAASVVLGLALALLAFLTYWLINGSFEVPLPK